MNRFIILTLMVGIISGCAYTQYTKLTEESFEPTTGEIMLTTKDLDEPYTELAIITSEGGTINQSKEAIVKKAKELGADAIIKLNCCQTYMLAGISPVIAGGASPSCSGLAVRLK